MSDSPKEMRTEGKGLGQGAEEDLKPSDEQAADLQGGIRSRIGGSGPGGMQRR